MTVPRVHGQLRGASRVRGLCESVNGSRHKGETVKTFSLVFQCDNAAFEGDDMRVEIVRILRSVAGKVEEFGPPDLYYPVRDVNGNTVGRCELAITED